MTPRELRRKAARDAVNARIISDGCRDYIVEVDSPSGAGLLRHRRGKVLRFRSLGEAHRLLARCGAWQVVLRQRVADDETSLLGTQVGFHDLPVAHRNPIASQP